MESTSSKLNDVTRYLNKDLQLYAVGVATAAAKRKLQEYGIDDDPATNPQLQACLIKHLVRGFTEGLTDMQLAIDHGMRAAAESSLLLSMRTAGLEAANEYIRGIAWMYSQN